MKNRQADQDPQASRRKAEEWASDIRWMMKHPAGRRVAWQLLAMAGVYANCFDANGARTSFNCGRQAVGQAFLAEIARLAPEDYITMQRENADPARQ